MKHIKTFEEIDLSGCSPREELLTLVCFYFEEVIQITEEEGFVECLYDDSDGLNKEYFTFHFRSWTDEDIYEKFEKFLKGLKAKIKNERVTNVDVQYDIKVSNAKMKEYADLYKNMEKFNI
jgi:hypothetical protein